MAATLHNTCNFCGINGYLEQMEEALKGLLQFYRKYPEPVICSILGMSLRNVIKPYAENRLFTKVEECLEELREISESHPKQVRTQMVMVLLDAYVSRKNHDVTLRPKVLDEYLMEIRDLYQKYHEENIAEGRRLFDKLITSLRTAYSENDKLNKDLTLHNDCYDSFILALRRYRK